MPITPVDKSLFPDVPNVLGVPALRRLGTAQQLRTLLISRILQRIILRKFTRANVWGLYDQNGVVVQCDSVVSFDFKGDSKVSEVPLQRGSFASYNKVQLPDSPTLRLSKGGTDEARNTFLNAIDAAKKSTNLYSIVTPSRTYLNVTIESYDYRQTAQDGISLLVVDLRIKEIRQVSPTFSTVVLADVKNPAAVSPRNSGLLQAVPVPAAQEQSLLSIILKSVGVN
jgi:hypothetical protein